MKKSSANTDNMVLFDLGGIGLALYPRKLLAEDATVAESDSGSSGVTFSYNAKCEFEVVQVLSEVGRCGGMIVKPARKVSWDGYSGYFKDLDGHLFEVAYNPFWPLDDKGNVLFPP